MDSVNTRILQHVGISCTEIKLLSICTTLAGPYRLSQTATTLSFVRIIRTAQQFAVYCTVFGRCVEVNKIRGQAPIFCPLLPNTLQSLVKWHTYITRLLQAFLPLTIRSILIDDYCQWAGGVQITHHLYLKR
jgi:hypothetical protein